MKNINRTTTNKGAPMILKKILREMRRGLFRLASPLHPFAYRMLSRKSKVVLSDVDATKSIIKIACRGAEFIEGFCGCDDTLTNALFEAVWGKFIRHTESKELQKLYNELVVNCDEVSRETASVCLLHLRFLMECGFENCGLLNLLVRKFPHFHTGFPNFHESQKRIWALSKAYESPYDLPSFFDGHGGREHLATAFGFLEFPEEIRSRVIGKDIIDGGGYAGDSAMVFTEYEPAKVYTFEPNPDTIPKMEATIMKNAAVLSNRKERIQIVPLALGKQKGTLELHSSGEFDPGARTMYTNYGCGKIHNVDVISIDEFSKTNSCNVGLIKLDVEGAEYDTIFGAKRTIIEHKPLLIISIYHTFKDFFEIRPLIESWGVDYKFEIRHLAPSVPMHDYVLLGW